MLMRLLLSIAIILSVLGIELPYASGEEFKSDIIQLSDSLKDGTPIKIEVRRKEFFLQYPYKNSSMWGGGRFVEPKTLVSTVEVTIGEEKNLLPLSAYSDLWDPWQVSLEKTQHGVNLIIKGGDAGTSYKAVLLFEKDYIRSRKVSLSEFPDETWQETVYSFVDKDSPR